MNESKFWQLLEYAKAKSNGDIKEQRQLIANCLADLDLEEIMEFYAISLEKRAQIYTREIWMAAALLMDGCGNDSFDDFREWLVSQSQTVFYNVLENPDNLANLFTNQIEFDYEELVLFTCIGMAYEMKTSQQELPPPLRPLKVSEWELRGDWCEDDKLIEKYPRLFVLHKKWYEDQLGW